MRLSYDPDPTADPADLRGPRDPYAVTYEDAEAEYLDDLLDITLADLDGEVD
jgi:hypothetical protein